MGSLWARSRPSGLSSDLQANIALHCGSCVVHCKQCCTYMFSNSRVYFSMCAWFSIREIAISDSCCITSLCLSVWQLSPLSRLHLFKCIYSDCVDSPSPGAWWSNVVILMHASRYWARSSSKFAMRMPWLKLNGFVSFHRRRTSFFVRATEIKERDVD